MVRGQDGPTPLEVLGPLHMLNALYMEKKEEDGEGLKGV